MRLSAVYSCVRVLSETFAVLPVRLYQRSTDGSKQEVGDHWLHRLLCRRPNRWQNAFEFREMLQGHLALRGNAFCQLTANGRGEITELLPIHPDAVKAEALPDGDYRWRIKQRDGGESVLPRSQIWHLRGLMSDGIMGLSPLECAREAIGMGLAAQDYGARFFANDARPGGGWIKFPGQFKDRAARDSFREQWQASQSGDNRGKTAVLEMGMEWHPVQVSNDDAQFLESRQFQVTEIARIFRVPPHLIGDLSRATFSNIEHQALEFVQYTMTPWAERWEASIEADLLLDDEAIEVEFDFANLLRGDAQARSSYYASGIVNGWLTRNEARLAENLPPLEDLDEPLMPVNLQEVGAAEAAESPAQEAAEDAQETVPEDEPAADASARLAAVLHANAARLARRIAARGVVDGGDVRVIAEALAVPEDRVLAWSLGPRAYDWRDVDAVTADLEKF